MNSSKKSEAGIRSAHAFTIVEIMVAIAVVAILSVIAIISYSAINGYARDDARKTHLGQIAKAWEAAYSNNGNFDTSCNTKKYGIPFIGSGSSERLQLCYGQIGTNYITGSIFLNAVGIKDTVSDPDGKSAYTYVFSPKTGEIEITAMMENPKSVSWIPNVHADVVTYYVYSTLRKRSNIYGLIPTVVPAEWAVVDITNPSNLILTNTTTSTSPVSDGTPATPILVSPTNGTGNIATGSVTFTWSPVSGATKYKVYIGTATGSWNINNGAVSLGTSLTTSILSANTTYYWTVEAWNGSLQGTKAGVWSLTTKAAVAPSYNIGNSLMFNGSSSYLSRTPASAGNQKKWTWSGWVKRSGLTGFHTLFAANEGSNQILFRFGGTGTDDRILLQNGNNAGTLTLFTNAEYRDPSAWMHVVLVFDSNQSTPSNRVKLYTNGTQITNFATATYPGQDAIFGMNGPAVHQIGYRSATYPERFSGYLADVNFIDSGALDPTAFGQFDSTTGQWVAKTYTGDYGKNGFHLDFSSGATDQSLWVDSAPITSTHTGANNWSVNGMTVVGNQMIDTPSNNFAVLNGVGKGTTVTLINGSLSASHAAFPVGSSNGVYGTIGISSGKWYWEATIGTISSGSPFIGVASIDQIIFSDTWHFPNKTKGYAYRHTGEKRNNSIDTSYGATYASGDVIGVKLDLDSGTLEFLKNNVSQGVAFTSLSGTFLPADANGTSAGSYADTLNFGQWGQDFTTGNKWPAAPYSDDGWIGKFRYQPPTGFKALSTANLPDPAIKKPKEYFDVLTYTGTNTSNQTLTGLSFMPDLVWIKSRVLWENHWIMDRVRGWASRLSSSLPDGAYTNTTPITSFNTDGFTIGDTNTAWNGTSSYVAWNWKRWSGTGSNGPGFDVITYTGTTAAQNVSHSLGVAPNLVLFKSRTANSTNWQVYHSSLGIGTRAGLLNGTQSSSADASTFWTNMSSSNISLYGNGQDVNVNGQWYVAYLWSEVPWFSKFGSYTGNGSADGPFVYTGFKPRWVMVKRTDVTDHWYTYDTARNIYNPVNTLLHPNLPNADANGANPFADVNSNGFKIRRGDDTGVNASGGTYIYAAFAEAPFKYATAR